MKTKVTIALITTLITSGCSTKAPPPPTEPKPTAMVVEFNQVVKGSVGEFEFAPERMAWALAFGDNTEGEGEWCDLTLPLDLVDALYKVQSRRRENTANITIDCWHNGDNFVLSSKHDTHVSVNFETLSADKKEGVAEVAFRLVNVADMTKTLELKTQLTFNTTAFDGE